MNESVGEVLMNERGPSEDKQALLKLFVVWPRRDLQNQGHNDDLVLRNFNDNKCNSINSFPLDVIMLPAYLKKNIKTS